MSTSAFGGSILYDPADVGADRYCDAAIIRDGVANSALHKADSAAQHRAVWVAGVEALWSADSDPWLVPSGDLSALALRDGVWYTMPLRGAYAPKVRASGAAYRLRVWLAGRSSDGGAVDFLVMVSPRSTRSHFVTFGGDPIWPFKTYSGITSTTIAELTADDATRILDVPKSVVDASLGLETWSTLTDLGGVPIGLRVPMLEVVVMARRVGAGSTLPELHGVAVEEVIGT
jgi:hypothetical protein